MAIMSPEVSTTQKHIDCPMVAVASSTSGSSYLMFSTAGAQAYTAIWAPFAACTLYAISASFINSANTTSTVSFCMYRNGTQYGSTPATAMSSTRQNVYTITSAVSIAVGDQIEIACFPNAAPGGTLTSQVYLHVVY